MSEMIERVGDAIWTVLSQRYSVDDVECAAAARAAIEAMREPTPHMVAQTCVWTADATVEQASIGAAAMRQMAETDERGLIAATEVARDWQTMIDTALSE